MRLETVHEAADDLPALIDAAMRGDDIVLTLDGHAAVRLVPVGVRPLGLFAGSIAIEPSFDAPLSRAEMRAFGYSGDAEPAAGR